MAVVCASSCTVAELESDGGAASADSDAPELSHGALRVDTLTSRVVIVADEITGTYDIALAGGKIFLTSIESAPYVRVFNAASGLMLRSFGRDGEGPGEFQHGASLLHTAESVGKARVWLRDATGTLTTFSADQLPHELTSSSTRSFRPQFSGGRRFASIDSARFVTTGHFFSGKASAWNFSSAIPLGVMMFSVEGLPLGSPLSINTGDARISAGEVSGAYEHVLCVQPDGQQLFLAYKLAGRVDIVDLRENSVTGAEVPLPFLPRIGLNPRTGRNEFWQGNRESRAAYMDCGSSQHHAFALFSGKRVGDFPGRDAAYSRFVHVFDWNGRLVRILMLDHSTLAIAVAPMGDLLYSIDHHGPNDQAQIRVTALPR